MKNATKAMKIAHIIFKAVKGSLFSNCLRSAWFAVKHDTKTADKLLAGKVKTLKIRTEYFTSYEFFGPIDFILYFFDAIKLSHRIISGIKKVFTKKTVSPIDFITRIA